MQILEGTADIGNDGGDDDEDDGGDDEDDGADNGIPSLPILRPDNFLSLAHLQCDLHRHSPHPSQAALTNLGSPSPFLLPVHGPADFTGIQ